MKALVAYFSAESGRTANVAKSLAAAIGADLFEIKPEKPYTSSDLNYMNPLARCNREHITKKQVPVSGKVENFVEYDTVLIGFPIWYGCAPNVVNTFCKFEKCACCVFCIQREHRGYKCAGRGCHHICKPESSYR